MAAFSASRSLHYHNHRLLLLLLVLVSFGIQAILPATDPGDVSVLRSLMQQWKNTPPSWRTSTDPCGSPWEGVVCNDSRVTVVDLSFNQDLTSSVSPGLGQLSKLNILIFAGCGFSGSIPGELGKLSQLSFLSMTIGLTTAYLSLSGLEIDKLRQVIDACNMNPLFIC